MSHYAPLPRHRRKLSSWRDVTISQYPQLEHEGGICRVCVWGKGPPFYQPVDKWCHCGESSSDRVSSLLTRKEPLSYQLLECLFLNYFQDVPRGFVMQGAPPSPSDQPSSLRAEEELPLRIEQVQNRSAPKRPGWQWEEWISDSWTLVVDEIALHD